MYTVTFYSYRGGVGQTTALVNVAVDLAVRGRNVLLIDFDLEAPSLPSFAPPRPEDDPHPGLVEFIDEYLRSRKAPDIVNYVYQAKPVGEGCGEIWVMPAGRGDDDYWRAFGKIDWQELYDFRDGFVLFEDIKFQLWESFHPEYVLVDARAGINDWLAICTRQLPDAVVMMFTPDSAGKAGAWDQAGHQRVLRDIVAESLQASPPRIDLLPVASKVPDLDGGGLDTSSLNEPEDLSGPDEARFIIDLAASIPHAPELLLEKQVFSDTRPSRREALATPRKRLPRAYRRLANALIRSNYGQDREGAQAFLKELQLHPDRAVAVPAIEPVDRWRNSTGQLDQVIRNFDHDPDILAHAASCLFLAGRYDPAMETLDRAIEIAPLLDSILWQRASYRRRLRHPGAVEDLLWLLEARTQQQPIPPHTARQMQLSRMPALRGKQWDPESPELDRAPLDTADPMTYDFRGIDPYVVSAFQQLRQHAPEKVAEALQKPRIQQLLPEARQALVENTPPSAEQDPECLIRARRWRTAIALLEARVAKASSPDPRILFYLAMAYWGDSNESRAIELCRSARELMLEGINLETSIQELNTNDLQEIPLWSLMFWRAGDATTARQFLDRCDELLSESEGDDFFSVWRFHSAKRDQFQEDCDSQRKMIAGKAAIRPVFLGKKRGCA
jgi:tetratricopeptide (TPR) repeat protein